MSIPAPTNPPIAATSTKPLPTSSTATPLPVSSPPGAPSISPTPPNPPPVAIPNPLTNTSPAANPSPITAPQPEVKKIDGVDLKENLQAAKKLVESGRTLRNAGTFNIFNTRKSALIDEDGKQIKDIEKIKDMKVFTDHDTPEKSKFIWVEHKTNTNMSLDPNELLKKFPSATTIKMDLANNQHTTITKKEDGSKLIEATQDIVISLKDKANHKIPYSLDVKMDTNGKPYIFVSGLPEKIDSLDEKQSEKLHAQVKETYEGYEIKGPDGQAVKIGDLSFQYETKIDKKLEIKTAPKGASPKIATKANPDPTPKKLDDSTSLNPSIKPDPKITPKTITNPDPEISTTDTSKIPTTDTSINPNIEASKTTTSSPNNKSSAPDLDAAKAQLAQVLKGSMHLGESTTGLASVSPETVDLKDLKQPPTTPSTPQAPTPGR